MPTAMRRTIGLGGAASTLIGYVVGASIFILPGELAASTGPGLWLAYLLAAVPALLSCFVSAQIGSAFPVSGATYVAVSRLVSPFWGFVVVWVILVSIAVGVALIAYGFADYLAFFVPGLPRMAVAIAAVLTFTMVNVLGATVSVRTQEIMVGGFVLALTVFGVGGMIHADWTLMVPMFPRGLGPVIGAAVPAYFSFIGFLVIVEIGGEIERPSRTIPIALAMSFCAVLILYTMVAVALPAVIPWTDLGTSVAPVAAAAGRFFTPIVAALISLGALLAATTTLNGILLGQSRDVYALARDRIFPNAIAAIHPRFRTPLRAIVTVGLVSTAGVLLGATITQYATIAVLGFMIIQILASIAVLILPSRDAERFARAGFKLRPTTRLIASWGLIGYSIVFMGLAVVQGPRAATVFAAFVGVGIIYFIWRKRWLERSGIPLAEALRKDWPVSEPSDE